MQKYFESISLLGLFFVMLSIDATTYYSQGRHHSLVPLLVCAAATLVVGIFVVMAMYQIHKHRNDKEPW